MRVFGYPPGWLLQAEVHSSGISMFDKDGKGFFYQLESVLSSNKLLSVVEVAAPVNELEEGEVSKAKRQ